MKLIVKNEATIGKEELKKMLECGGLHVSDELEIDGALWRVLKIEGRKIMIWKHTGLNISSVFSRDGSNKYEGSDLQKAFRKMETPEELKGLITDEGFFPLSIEEIRELLPTEADRIATDEEGNTVWWWTRSCTRGYGNYAWNVNPSGTVYSYYAAYHSFACAPACVIC